MVIEIDFKKLKEDLINVYSGFLSTDKKIKSLALEKAKMLDGLWSGSFLFPDALEWGVNNLTYLYVEPHVATELAKKILKKLEETQFS